MALERKLVTFTATGAAGATQDITGTTFTPKAAIVWGTLTPTVDTFENGLTHSYGFTDGTNQRCCNFTSQDNAGTSSTGCTNRNDSLIWFGSTTIATGYATNTGRASFTSWLANGMRITWNTAMVTAGVELHVLFLGGTDITNVEVGTWSPLINAAGSYSKTGMAFKPDYIQMMHTVWAVNVINTAQARAAFGIGHATSVTAQNSIMVLIEDAATSADTWNAQSDNSIVTMMQNTTGTFYDTLPLTSINNDGWTGTTTKAWDSSNGQCFFYLAMKGGNYATGKITTPAATGNQTTTTNKDCKAVQIFGTASAVQRTSGAQAYLSVGAGTASTERVVTFVGDRDAPTVMDTCARYETTSIYLTATPSATATASTILDEADLNAVSTTGFTLNWTNVGSAFDLYYVTFGNATTLTQVIKTLNGPRFDIMQALTDTNTFPRFDIRQEVTDTNTVPRFDVRQEITDTNTILADIRQAVTDTNTLIHDIRQALTDTNTLIHHVRADVTDTNSLMFDITTTLQVEKMITLLLDIRQSLIDTNTTLFQVNQTITDTNTLLFDTRQALTDTNTTIFDVRQGVDKTRTLVHDIRFQPVKTATLPFSVIQAVTKTGTKLFDVRNFITSSDREFIFNVTVPVPDKQLSTLFNIEIQYRFYEFVLHNANSADVAGALLIDETTGTSAEVSKVLPASTPTAITFITPLNYFIKLDWESNNLWTWRFRVITPANNSVIESVELKRMDADGVTVKSSKSSGTINTSIATAGVKSGTIDWSDGTENPGTKEADDRLAITFNLLNSHGSQSRTVGYGTNLAGGNDETTSSLRLYFTTQIFKTSTLLYNLRQDATKTNTLLQDIRAAVTKTWTNLWHLRLDAEKQLVLLNHIIYSPVKSTSLLFHVREQILTDKTLTLQFHARQLVEKMNTYLFDERQEVTDTYTLLQHIAQDMTKMTSLLHDVRGGVTQAEDLLYDIRQDVAKSNPIRYDIVESLIKTLTILQHIESEFLNRIEKSLTLRNHIAQDVTKTTTILFDELQQLVDSTTWLFDIRQSATKQLVTNADIRQGLDKQLSVLQEIKGLVDKSTTMPMHIRTDLVKTTTLLQNLITQATKATTLLFNTNHQPVKTTELLFNVMKVFEDTNTLLYHIVQRVPDKETTLDFQIRGLVEKLLTQLMHMEGAIGIVVKTMTLLTSINVPVEFERTTRFHIQATITKTANFMLQILGQAVQRGVFNYAIQNRMTATRSINFNVTEPMQKTTTLVFKVFNDVLKQNTVLFNTLQHTRAKQLDTKFNIQQQITRAKELAFNMNNEVAKMLELDMKITTDAKTQITTRFTVIGQIGKSLSLQQDIFQEVVKQNQLLVDIMQSVDVDNQFRFDVIAQTTKILKTLYDIRQVFEWSKTLVYSIMPQDLKPKVSIHENLLNLVQSQYSINNPNRNSILWHEWYNGQSDITIESIFVNHFDIGGRCTPIYKERNYSLAFHLFYRDYADTNPADRNVPSELSRIILEVNRILEVNKFNLYNEFPGKNVYEMRISEAKFLPEPENSSNVRIWHYKWTIELLYQKLIL